MMLSIMVVGAGAAFADQDQIDTKHQEAVDMCNALNIITGFENGKFMPKDNVTREQMAKMICVLDNGGKEPQLSAGNTFTDVPADRWSNKYVEACASRGIVVGVGGGKFAPAGKVTATQAAKMLLVELGYDDQNQQYTGSDWATKVNVDATKKGYYVDLEDIDVNAPLTREHAAQMVWNALKANEVEYTNQFTTDANGNLVATPKVQDKIDRTVNGIPQYITLLADKYGVIDNEGGQMIGFSYDSNKGEWTYTFATNDRSLITKNGGGKVADFTATGSIKSTTDYTDLFGQNVKVIYTMDKSENFDKVFGIYADESSVIKEGIVGDIDTKSVNGNEVKIDGTTYKTDLVASNVPYTFFHNNIEAVAPNTLGKLIENNNKLALLNPFNLKAIDNDNDGKIDLMVITPFNVGQVTYAGTKNFNIEVYNDFNTGTATKFNFEDVNAYSGLAKDDFVVYTPALYSTTEEDTFVKVDTVLAGQISGVNAGKDRASVDSTWYDLMPSVAGDNAPKAKDNVKDAPVVNGYIFTLDASGSMKAEDYAVVIGYDFPDAATNNIDSARVKLLLSDGSKVTGDAANYNPETKKEFESDNDFINYIKELYDADTKIGKLVTFEKNSDNEYELTPAPTVAKGSGFDTVLSTTITDKGSGSKATYIDGANIADDAVVFLKDGSSYKVINGAKLKTLTKTGLTVQNAYANDGSNGYSNAALVYVTSGSAQVDELQYAYVTAEPITAPNADGKTVYKYELWTKDGAKTLYTDTLSRGDSAGLKKGDVVAFKLNDNDEINSITSTTNTDLSAAPTESLVGATLPLTGVLAMTAYDGTYVSFWDRTVSRSDGSDKNDTYGTVTVDNVTRFEITKDTVILYVDSKTFAGVADASTSNIRQATEMAKDTDGNVTGYYNNVVAIVNSDKELDLLVVDINNDILDLM